MKLVRSPRWRVGEFLCLQLPRDGGLGQVRGRSSARLEDIFRELANWNARQCGDEDVAEHRRRLNELHGYFEDGEYTRPICERILAKLNYCNVVTRNRYGAEVLNSSDTCFIDIDHVRRTFGEVVRGWFGGPARLEDVLTARIEALLSRAENRGQRGAPIGLSTDSGQGRRP